MPTIKKHNNRRTVQQRTTEGTASRRNNGTIGESKCTNHSRPLWYKWYHAISQPYRLKKTSSKQSKCRDLHLKWLHRETNDNTLYYNSKNDSFSPQKLHDFVHFCNQIWTRCDASLSCLVHITDTCFIMEQLFPSVQRNFHVSSNALKDEQKEAVVHLVRLKDIVAIFIHLLWLWEKSDISNLSIYSKRNTNGCKCCCPHFFAT